MSLVLRRDDRELLDAMADLTEATLDIGADFLTPCEKINEGVNNSAQLSESLAHPKHSASLNPIRTDLKAVLARYFRRQKTLLLDQVSEHLKHVADNNKNLKEREAIDQVSYALPDGMLLPLAVTAGMSADYEKALLAALASGYLNLAGELSSEVQPSDTFFETYLRDNSLTKLTGDLSDTTVQRLRNALADAYESGATFEEMVQAIRDEYADFSTARAAMIAQTESNAAYNGGRKQLGLDLGFNEKSWDPDATACPICLLNVLQGWIGIEEEFESGDQTPGAHPNCDCSLDVRLNNDAEESNASQQ